MGQEEVTVADEHVATVLSYRALLPLQEPLQIAPPRSRERVVLAAVEGQAHVLGLRMVADVLEGAGFRGALSRCGRAIRRAGSVRRRARAGDHGIDFHDDARHTPSGGGDRRDP